jgi:SAM-dependent methyltransferase
MIVTSTPDALDRGAEIARRFYPEIDFGGFSRADASIEFYTRIAALLRPADHLLDYGAGRGAQILEDPVAFRRGLKTFRGRVAHVEGCDIDPTVFDNPFLDHAALFQPDGALPYPDASFDIVHAHWVFEHVQDAEHTAAELLRVTKSGGTICAITPNKHGYIALAARLAGNANHVPLLRRIQPDRLDYDVFPTIYRLNTVTAVREAFGKGAEVAAYCVTSDPSYHFNKPPIYAAFKLLHALLPEVLAPVLLMFATKR